ncbi:hypothetical protein ACFRIC_41085 [Streptomyces sp. NPDC056738]
MPAAPGGGVGEVATAATLAVALATAFDAAFLPESAIPYLGV